MTLGRPKRTKKRQLEAQDSVPHDGASESEFDDAESPSGDESDVVSHDGASESKPREAQEIRADFERRKAEILAALKKPAKPALDRTPEAIAERAALSSFSIAERAVLKPPKPPKPPTEMAPYSAVEDERIVSLVKTYGTERWSKIAEEYNKMLSEGDCRRNDKQIRGRYVWQLDPNISRDEWTDDEIKIIREMQARLGNKYASKRKDERKDTKAKRGGVVAKRKRIASPGPPAPAPCLSPPPPPPPPPPFWNGRCLVSPVWNGRSWVFPVWNGWFWVLPVWNG
ncbi:RNA polymerase II transcription regulator recruiting protein [Aureococcus anophagefferens]|nr:RNA polymerase II transcription regulator recruiting protein [Aureococcus anophagefferens]